MTNFLRFLVVGFLVLGLFTAIAAAPVNAQRPQLIWKHTWGGVGPEEGAGVDSDGRNVYISGKTDSFGVGWESYVAKFDSDGTLLWDRTWGGTGNEYTEYHCAATDGTNVYITGWTDSFGTGRGEAFLAKFNSEGELQWDRTWGGDAWESAWAIVSDGKNVYITGATESFGSGAQEVYLAKFNSEGELQWDRTWGGDRRDYSWGLASDGKDVYISGTTDSFSAVADEYNAFVAKFDGGGNLEWDVVWGGTEWDEGYGVAVGEGSVYLAGDAESFGVKRDAFLAKFDSNGNLEWDRTWGGDAGDTAWDVVWVGGFVYPGGGAASFGGAAWLAQFDAFGNLRWDATWDINNYFYALGPHYPYATMGSCVYATGTLRDFPPPTLMEVDAVVGDPSATIIYPSANVGDPSATVADPVASVTDPDATIDYPVSNEAFVIKLCVPSAVGGEVTPINSLALTAPWIALVAAAIALGYTITRRKSILH